MWNERGRQQISESVLAKTSDDTCGPGGVDLDAASGQLAVGAAPVTLVI